MNARLTRWFLPRIPAIVLGAAAGFGLTRWLRPEGGAYDMFGSAALGAIVGVWVHHDLRGLYKALRTGVVRTVLVWAVLGALAGGMLGLLIWRLDARAAKNLPWLFMASLWGTWLRCALIGAGLALLQVGDHYDDALPSKPKSD